MHETLTFTMVFLFGQSAIRKFITPCTRSWKHPPHLLVDILQAIWPYVHSCGISLELKLLITQDGSKSTSRLRSCLDEEKEEKPAMILYITWNVNIDWWIFGIHLHTEWRVVAIRCVSWKHGFQAVLNMRQMDVVAEMRSLDWSMTPQIAWPNWKTTQFR